MQKLLKFLPFSMLICAGVLPGMELPVDRIKDSKSDNSECQTLMQEMSRETYCLHCKENADAIFAFENCQMESNIVPDLCENKEYSLRVFIDELIAYINNSPDIQELSGKFKNGFFTLKKPFLAVAYKTGPEYTPDTVTLYNLSTKDNITVLIMDESKDYCISIEKILFNKNCSELFIQAEFPEEKFRYYTTHKAPMKVLKNKLSLDNLRRLRDYKSDFLDEAFDSLNKLGE
jgi:hypothetical protein